MFKTLYGLFFHNNLVEVIRSHLENVGIFYVLSVIILLINISYIEGRINEMKRENTGTQSAILPSQRLSCRRLQSQRLPGQRPIQVDRISSNSFIDHRYLIE